MTSPKPIDSHSLSLGEIFRKPFSYKVPFYQRDYAWTDEEVDELWDDISSNLLEHSSSGYFLGAIVVSPGPDDKTRYVVDGQQRLATLSMLFSAISNQWSISGDQKRADGVTRDYIGAEDRRTGEIIPKLSLNETNDPIFQSVVLRRESPPATEKKNWPQSNKKIDRAFSKIKGHLSAWLDTFDDKESSLLDLEDFLVDQISVISIDVGDDADAFVIFETLNDRGLELAVSDLVKNYLFSLAGNNLERFKQQWFEIALLVGSSNVTQFLRHYWLSTVGLVRERDLYRELRRSVRNQTKARQFIERLRSAANFYSALNNPEHEYWDDFSAEATEQLEALLIFGVTQYRPVMLAAMELFEPTKVTKVLKLLAIISFRYTIISGLGTGNLERMYTDAALSIRDETSKSAKQVFSKVRMAYVDDDSFSEYFSTKRFTKAAIARYILSEINNSKESTTEKQVSHTGTKVTLEHILPKNPGREWRGSYQDNDELMEVQDQIGNLTLLERGKNRGVANASFILKKKKAFKISELAINQDLLTEDEWNSNKIRSRSKSLSMIAKNVWRVDY